MVNTYAVQSGGCRFESLWGFGFFLKGAHYEVLTIVEKNLLSWTAMHIDFVMCKNRTALQTNLYKNETFFHNGNLTSIRIVFCLNKTLFTHFDYDYVRIKCLLMTQNRTLLISSSKMPDYLRKKCEQSLYLNSKLSLWKYI